ncbi:MAG: MATE family efflux transporter, partial [Pseudomonadota bacterium]
MTVTPHPKDTAVNRAPVRGAFASEVRATIRLALPLALTQVGQLAMFTTDLMIIGRLGEDELAGAALAHTVLFTAFLIGMGVTSGVAPLTAQALGAGDERMVRRSVRVGLHAVALIALPMIAFQLYSEPILLALGQAPVITQIAVLYLSTLAWAVLPAWGFMALRGYMSALDVPNPGLWIMLAGIPVNAALAYVLVFGFAGLPALGIIGAGIATTAVNVAMLVAAALVVARHHRLNAYAPFERIWRPDWQQLRRLLAIGLPATIAFAMENGLFTAAALMAGAISATALASHQIALQVAAVVFMVPLGFGLAASVRVGERYGAGDMAGAVRAGRVAILLGIVVTTTTTLLTLSATTLLPMLFLGERSPTNAAVFDLASVLLVFAAAFFIVDGMQTILAGALRG